MKIRKIIAALVLPAAAAAGILAAAPAGASTAMPRFLPAATGVPTTMTAFVSRGPDGTALATTLTTVAGVPLAGQTVTFTTQGASRLLCTEVTDLNGDARCFVSQAQITQIRNVSKGVWWGRYAGDGTFAPTAHAGHA